MKQFDPSKPYCRRDKRPSKIIYTTPDGRHVVITEDDANFEYAYEVNPLGRLIDIDREKYDSADLVNIPEKIEGWINIYKGVTVYFTSDINETKDIAKTKCNNRQDVVARKFISFTEGEGLND